MLLHSGYVHHLCNTAANHWPQQSQAAETTDASDWLERHVNNGHHRWGTSGSTLVQQRCWSGSSFRDEFFFLS